MVVKSFQVRTEPPAQKNHHVERIDAVEKSKEVPTWQVFELNSKYLNTWLLIQRIERVLNRGILKETLTHLAKKIIVFKF